MWFRKMDLRSSEDKWQLSLLMLVTIPWVSYRVKKKKTYYTAQGTLLSTL